MSIRTGIAFLTAGLIATALPTMASAAVVLTDPGAGPGTTTVTFDDPALAQGTVITNQYASAGLTVSGQPLYASNAYTNSSAVMVGMHAASFGSGASGSSQAIWDFIFASPVQFAGAYFEFNSPTSATFQAFLAGNLVDSYTYSNNNCCGSPEFIGFSGGAFDTFRLSNVTGNDFYMEDLRFSSVNGAVPEPSTWAMMLLGFGGIGFGMRRVRSQQQRKLRVRHAF